MNFEYDNYYYTRLIYYKCYRVNKFVEIYILVYVTNDGLK